MMFIFWLHWVFLATHRLSLVAVNSDSMEKSLLLGKIEGRRRRGHQKMRWLNGITCAVDMNLGKLC